MQQDDKAGGQQCSSGDGRLFPDTAEGHMAMVRLLLKTHLLIMVLVPEDGMLVCPCSAQLCNAWPS